MTSDPPAGSGLPASRRGAAVTLLKTVRNPIELARALYEDPIACPHAYLSGPDAERIAAEHGLEIVDNSYFDTKQRWREHEDGEKTVRASDAPPEYVGPKGTVGAVVMADGVVACATSTGGKTNKNGPYCLDDLR